MIYLICYPADSTHLLYDESIVKRIESMRVGQTFILTIMLE